MTVCLEGSRECNTQVINYSHLFPTRYALELESLKGTVAAETFKEPSQRVDAKKLIKKQLEERYQGGKNKWFFQPLRVCFGYVIALRISTDLLRSTVLGVDFRIRGDPQLTLKTHCMYITTCPRVQPLVPYDSLCILHST